MCYYMLVPIGGMRGPVTERGRFWVGTKDTGVVTIFCSLDLQTLSSLTISFFIHYFLLIIISISLFSFFIYFQSSFYMTKVEVELRLIRYFNSKIL